MHSVALLFDFGNEKENKTIDQVMRKLYEMCMTKEKQILNASNPRCRETIMNVEPYVRIINFGEELFFVVSSQYCISTTAVEIVKEYTTRRIQ